MIDAISPVLMQLVHSEVAMLIVKATLLAVIGFSISRCLSRGSAAVRHSVLGATLAALFVLPILAVFSPVVEVSVLPAAPLERFELPRNHTSQAATASTTRLPDNPTAVQQGNARPQWWLVIYVTGVAIVLLHLLLGLRRIHQLTQGATDASKTIHWRKFRQLACKRPYRVLLCERVAAPLTWGFFRPILLLPANACHWPDDVLENVFRHEHAHIERGDWQVQIIARLVCAMYWFNPLVWLVYRQLLLEAERAADNIVLKSGTNPGAYASQLVDFARNDSLTSARQIAATGMAEQSSLHKRIDSILKTEDWNMRFSKTSASVAVLTCVASSLLLGSLRLVAAPLPEDHNDVALEVTTPLIRASYFGDADSVRQLLRQGADVNEIVQRKDEPSRFQRTALNSAVIAGNTQIVDLLLSSGAEANQLVHGDASPLIAAIRYDHDDIAELLIAHGADVSLAVAGDGAPLIEAAARGNTDMVRKLVALGADVNQAVRNDENALYYSIVRHDMELLAFLIDAGVNVKRRIPGEDLPLLVALEHENDRAAKLLVAAGALD